MLIMFIIKGRCWHISIGGLGSVINTKPVNISGLWHPAQPLPHALVLLSWKLLKADLGKQLKANLGNSMTYGKWKWSFKTTQTVLVFPITFDLLARASHGSVWTDRDQNNLSSAQPSAPSPAKHPPCPRRPPPCLGRGWLVKVGLGLWRWPWCRRAEVGGLGQRRTVDLDSLLPPGVTRKPDTHHQIAHPEHSYSSISLGMCFKVPELCWEYPFLPPEVTFGKQMVDAWAEVSSGAWFINKRCIPGGSHLNMLKVWNVVGVHSRSVEKWVSKRPFEQMCNCLLAWKMCLLRVILGV